MQTVRRRIIDILKEQGSATVAELAGELKMAQVSIRHHLDILVGEDLVEISGLRRQNGAGRPSLIYSLTPQAAKLFPQNHDVLAGAVLEELKSALPAAEVERVIQRIGEKVAQEAPSAVPGQPIRARLDEVTQFLSQKGYNARWEERDGNYEIHTCNRPYAGVSDAHPELCLMDQAMMGQLLPEAIRVQSRVLSDATRCTYVIQGNGTPSDAT